MLSQKLVQRLKTGIYNWIVIEIIQELVRAFVLSEMSEAINEKISPDVLTDSFHRWAAHKLKSLKRVWLYYMCVSIGTMLVILEQLLCSNDLFCWIIYITVFRLNNVPVAKGCIWCLKGLLWSNSLPLYQEAILQSGIAEDIQVRAENNLPLNICLQR